MDITYCPNCTINFILWSIKSFIRFVLKNYGYCLSRQEHPYGYALPEDVLIHYDCHFIKPFQFLNQITV